MRKVTAFNLFMCRQLDWADATQGKPYGMLRILLVCPWLLIAGVCWMVTLWATPEAVLARRILALLKHNAVAYENLDGLLAGRFYRHPQPVPSWEDIDAALFHLYRKKKAVFSTHECYTPEVGGDYAGTMWRKA